MLRKWNIVDDQSNASYDLGNEIIYNTEALKSNLCDYNDANILIRAQKLYQHKYHLKFLVVFSKCITKIDEATINDVEDLDLYMSIYNLTEYSSSYSETTGSFYFKDEATDFNPNIDNDNDFNSLKYKGLVTHSDILKIYRIVQYSKSISQCNIVKNIFKIHKEIISIAIFWKYTESFNILKIFSSVTLWKIFLKYIKRSYFYSKR